MIPKESKLGINPYIVKNIVPLEKSQLIAPINVKINKVLYNIISSKIMGFKYSKK
tara:strand:+ start:272 stop:436 length:165 start_codon:yes stop_codon:yes gene_type:complete